MTTGSFARALHEGQLRLLILAAGLATAAFGSVTTFLSPIFHASRPGMGQQQELTRASEAPSSSGHTFPGCFQSMAAVGSALIVLKAASNLRQRATVQAKVKKANMQVGWHKTSIASSNVSSFVGTSSRCVRVAPEKSSRIAMRWTLENFTEKALKSLMKAQQESRDLQQDVLDAPTIVLGIVAEGKDVGARVLLRLGATVDKARGALIDTIGFGQGGRSVEMNFTPLAKSALEDALKTSNDEGAAHVSTANMLRSILKLEDEQLGMFFMRLLGCPTMDIIRHKLSEELIKEQNAEREAAGVEPLQVKAEDLQLPETLKYSQDLTAAAAEGKLDPLIGRDEQLMRTIRILGRRSKNNPVLVGEAGVGKTSIAHGLAQRIYEGRVPRNLKDKRVLQLDLAQLLAGTRYRGDFEERLRAVVAEVTNAERRVILVLDEVHTLVGAGSGGGSEGGGIDAANLLKPALARGELQCIGATTYDEYRQHIEKDPALERRFQPVHVPEPSQDEAKAILAGLAPKYERHHKLRYTQEALDAAVRLSAQYIPDRNLPDKAIDVMDEAGSKVRQTLYEEAEQGQTLARRLALDSELEDIRVKKKAAAAEERYEVAQELKIRESEIVEELSALQRDMKAASPEKLLRDLEKLQVKVKTSLLREAFVEETMWTRTLFGQAVFQMEESVDKWANTSFDLSSELSRARAKMRLMSDRNRALLTQNNALQDKVNELEAKPLEDPPSSTPQRDVERLKDQQLRGVLEQNFMLHSEQDTLVANAKKMETEEKQLESDKAHLMVTVQSLMRDNTKQKNEFQEQATELQGKVAKLERRLAAQKKSGGGKHENSANHNRVKEVQKKHTAANDWRNHGAPSHKAVLKVRTTPEPVYGDVTASDDTASDMGDTVAMDRYVHAAQMRRVIEQVEPREEDVDMTSVPGTEGLSVDVGKLLKSAQGVLRDISQET
mmetsp:Transcript_46996/g.109548  ORF Transcript_46996/g.109548 Transcript_46996/m.109548 type:complete len:949 (+) Transcript_46996:107-2953(+)